MIPMSTTYATFFLLHDALELSTDVEAPLSADCGQQCPVPCIKIAYDKKHYEDPQRLPYKFRL